MSYRKPIYSGLDNFFEEVFVIDCSCFDVFLYSSNGQAKKTSWIRMLYASRNCFLFVAAFTGSFRLLLITLVLLLLTKKTFSHGQAFFKKIKPNLFSRLIACFWLSISSKYIAYSHIGLDHTFVSSTYRTKTVVCYNRFESLHSLSAINQEILPASKFSLANPFRLVFIGRLRPLSGLDLLLNAINSCLKQKLFFQLQCFGCSLDPNPHILSYGNCSVLDIQHLSAGAQIGIYPGDSGLSVLHYMSLGLCPVTHDSLRLHCGPEPAYLIDGINGFNFKRHSLDSLIDLLKLLYDNPDLVFNARVQARKTAMQIHSVNYSEELSSIMNVIP